MVPKMFLMTFGPHLKQATLSFHPRPAGWRSAPCIWWNHRPIGSLAGMRESQPWGCLVYLTPPRATVVFPQLALKTPPVRRQMKPTPCEPPGGPYGRVGIPRRTLRPHHSPVVIQRHTQALNGAFIVNTCFAQALNQYYSQLLFEWFKTHAHYFSIFKSAPWHRWQPCPTRDNHSMTVNTPAVALPRLGNCFL